MLSSVFRRQHSLANAAMLAHRQGQFLLDKAFALIEGHPRFGEGKKQLRKHGTRARARYARKNLSSRFLRHDFAALASLRSSLANAQVVA